MSAIDGRLELTGRGLALTGRAAVNDVPVDFTWDEAFADGEASRLEVAGRLDEAARARLGVDALPGVAGPVGVTATLIDHDGTRQSVRAVVDLSAAALAIPPLDYAKPAGVAARMEVDLGLRDLRPTEAPRVLLAAPGLTAEGRIDFAPDGSVALVDLPDIAFDRHRVAARVSWLDDESLSVELRGAFLDLEALIDGGPEAPDADPTAADGAAPAAELAAPPTPPVALSATLAFDRVAVRKDGELIGVTGVVVFDGEHWRRIDLAGATERGGRVAVTYADDGAARRLVAEAVGLGAVLDDLAITDGVDGGLLVADLTMPAGEVRPAGSPWPRFTGSIRAERFRVREVPLLARLIAALSISGLQSLMQTDGLVFERAAIDLASDGATVRLDDGRAFGGALGLRLDGAISLPAESLEAYGTIVPVYGVNGFLAGIPLIGDLLTGSSGGIFAFTYAIDGPLDAPDVSVNPLSVLAPGFLRDIFFLGDTDDEIAEGEGSDRQWDTREDR